MFNGNNMKLQALAVHYIGNRGAGENMKLANGLLQPPDELVNDLLPRYFLSPFKNEAFYHFTHSAHIELNEVYNYARAIFADPGCLYLQSVNLAQLLYEHSEHPRIKGGELYVVYFSQAPVEGGTTDALGIFKSESKETYLKVYSREGNFAMESENGININKLDKGCLIFNTAAEKGYKVCMVDNLSKAGEAQYWKEDFLQLKPLENEYFQTRNYLNLCKQFVEDELPAEITLERKDQINLLQRSVDYFAKKETFSSQEFEQDVISSPELIGAFRQYESNYRQQNDLGEMESFAISPSAVKEARKRIRSVLKLDKNFHVYVHAHAENIEKGFDENRGMKYYKLYYKEES